MDYVANPALLQLTGVLVFVREIASKVQIFQYKLHSKEQILLYCTITSWKFCKIHSDKRCHNCFVSSTLWYRKGARSLQVRGTEKNDRKFCRKSNPSHYWL